MWSGTIINRTQWHISILSYQQPADRLKLVNVIRINRTWHISIQYFLSLAFRGRKTRQRLSQTIINHTYHISILSYLQPADRLKLVNVARDDYWRISILCYPLPVNMLKLVCIARNPNQSYLAHPNTFKSLACRPVEIGIYGQERLLIVLGTPQYFLIHNLHTRSNCKAWARKLINRTWHISVLSYPLGKMAGYAPDFKYA